MTDHTETLINSLTDQFKHRHQFFWADYFRILIYELTMLTIPYLVLVADFEAFPDQTFRDDMVGFALIILGLWVWFHHAHITECALAEEHHRVKKVHDELKRLLTKEGIDLNVPKVNTGRITDMLLIQYRWVIRGVCIVNVFLGYKLSPRLTELTALMWDYFDNHILVHFYLPGLAIFLVSIPGVIWLLDDFHDAHQ